MAQIQTMSIPEFMSGMTWDDSTIRDTLVRHFEKHKIKYRIIGTAIILFFGINGVVDASSGIDASGRRLYAKVLQLGKWIIIIKGGWDTISCMVKGDFETAKKSFLSYILIYVTMIALPWALNEVDTVFKDM